MSLLLLLATLPALYWAQPVETAPALKQAGIERLCVPTEAAAAWTAAGFTVVPLGEKDRAERTKLSAPGLRSRADVASASVRPWVNANGWRFLRKPGGRYWGDVPAGKAALAAAEAFAYGADAVLAIDPADLETVGRMLAFLSSVPDSSAAAGRRHRGRGRWLAAGRRDPEPDGPTQPAVRGGAEGRPPRRPQRPDRLEGVPPEGGAEPRDLCPLGAPPLTDEKRSLRLYGSEVVLARLVRDAGHARLHLLNYGGRPIDGLRVRLLGSWVPGEARAFGEARLAVEDLVAADGATEFSLGTIGPYAIVDLRAAN